MKIQFENYPKHLIIKIPTQQLDIGSTECNGLGFDITERLVLIQIRTRLTVLTVARAWL